MIDGEKKIIAFASHKFSETERNWSTLEQECFGIFFAICHWESILMGHQFTVETDHRNLEYLEKSTVPKLIRWRLRLQEFDFDVRHIAGKENCTADAFARCLATVDNEDVNSDINMIQKYHNAVVGHHGVTRTITALKENG